MKKMLLFLFLLIRVSWAQELHILEFDSVAETQAFFAFENRCKVGPIISGHRGGAAPGFPENNLSTLERTLEATPAIFEVDVRMTADQKIVLLHDASLERTTTGSGTVKDYLLSELQDLSLKDPTGQVTDFTVPSLEDAIHWSKGKTLINLDVKDVPMEKKLEVVRRHDAFAYVIFTVHSPQEAQFFYTNDPRSMFSAFVKSEDAFHAYEKAGIPWENVLMAYVGPWSKPENRKLYELLHDRGVRVMISAASSYDKLEDPDKRAEAYRTVILEGADILESDRPIEVAEALKSLRPQNDCNPKEEGTAESVSDNEENDSEPYPPEHPN